MLGDRVSCLIQMYLDSNTKFPDLGFVCLFLSINIIFPPEKCLYQVIKCLHHTISIRNYQPTSPRISPRIDNYSDVIGLPQFPALLI